MVQNGYSPEKALKKLVNRENRTSEGILKSIFAIGIVASASLLIHFHALRNRGPKTWSDHDGPHQVKCPLSPEKT